MKKASSTMKTKCTGNEATTNGCTCATCAESDRRHAEALERQAAEYRAKYPFPWSVAIEDGWLILSAELESVF